MSEEPLLHVILHQPEIPQNTGNIGRMCAITRARLHLIHPLGFKIQDKHLKRSGMDYWEALDKHEHESWEAFLGSPARPQRIWAFTTHADKAYWDVSFEPGDGLLFGSEGFGLPYEVHQWVGERRVTIPHRDNSLRSINLATSAGIATFEALRQLRDVAF